MNMKFKYGLVFFFVFSLGVFAQRKDFADVNMDKLLEETQISSNSDANMELVWWIPTEYWQVAFSQDKSISKAEREMIINMIKEYVFVVFIKGEIGVFGGITYEDKELVRKNSNVFYNGNMLKKIKEKNLPTDLQNMLNLMKPVMKNIIGPLGENMQFVVFKNDKKNAIDSYKEGTVSFELFNFKPEVELPLGSLLVEKKCEEGNKLYNGKWAYCPFHGKELVSQ
ncbi:hypothetical protein [uncultured Tenacibaculum sp.]|uniref:hypothetical protein n=1 Tax=uncultured Tenacibaculum sp. TaxID=174713 RepID=UPI00261A400F|nr:hypothetical protein [uncultured Tenacibaculum sp.]